MGMSEFKFNHITGHKRDDAYNTICEDRACACLPYLPRQYVTVGEWAFYLEEKYPA